MGTRRLNTLAFRRARHSSGFKTAALLSDDSVFRSVPIALLTAAAYYAGTLAGFALTPPGATVSTLWPPNALLFASLLLLPKRHWWVVAAMVFPAHMAAQLQMGIPIARAFGWFISNSAEAFIGASCVLRFGGAKTQFDSVRGAVVFLTFGFLFAPFITSFLDAAVVVATGWDANYWTMWTRRLFTNMLSILAIVPPLVIVGRFGLHKLRRASLAQYAEFAFVIVSVFVVSAYIFGERASSQRSAPVLIYAPIPFLLWATVRTGPGGLSASLLVVALVSIWEAIHGRAVFTSVSMRENVLYLQISYCMVALPLMLLAAMLSERRSTEMKLRESKAKMIEAQEQERQRIAGELHDNIGQQLALAEIRISELKSISAAEWDPALDRLSAQLAEIAVDIREISHGLYPSVLQNLGLAPALRRLIQEIKLQKSVSLTLTSEQAELISPEVSVALYRTAQEALHNVEKHSHAQHVRIELTQVSDGLLLRIRDDGIGFLADREPSRGLGIDSMQARLRAIGGKLRITSAPTTGTEVEAFAPLKQADSLARTG